LNERGLIQIKPELRDQARRIASNMAKLSELCAKDGAQF